MGKEFPLAREEEEGQPVLLAGTSSGECEAGTCTRKSRAKVSSASRGRKVRKIKYTKTKSQGSVKTEGADASPIKEDRRRRGYKDRKSDRGDEREDKPVGRSASELGIVHPGSYCDELNTVPHYWIDKEHTAKGILFQCKLCYAYLWNPLGWPDIDRLSKLIKQYGRDEGYCIFITSNKAAKILMAKMQDLRRLEMETTDKREFAKLADKILSNREYDKK